MAWSFGGVWHWGVGTRWCLLILPFLTRIQVFRLLTPTRVPQIGGLKRGFVAGEYEGVLSGTSQHAF